MEILKEAYSKEGIYYTYDFDRKDDPGAGFSFPCDSEGTVIFSDLNEGAQESFLYCMNNMYRFHEPKVRKHRFTERHEMFIRCDCGCEFELHNEYLGACGCPKCDSWYNLFGQKLINPQFWRELDDF